jgi:tripeptide aminopeptidase
MRNRILAAGLLASMAVSSGAAQAPDARVQALLASPAFRQAVAFIESDQERFVRELVTLTEIPSPPFKEQARAKAYPSCCGRRG